MKTEKDIYKVSVPFPLLAINRYYTLTLGGSLRSLVRYRFKVLGYPMIPRTSPTSSFVFPILSVLFCDRRFALLQIVRLFRQLNGLTR